MLLVIEAGIRGLCVDLPVIRTLFVLRHLHVDFCGLGVAVSQHISDGNEAFGLAVDHYASAMAKTVKLLDWNFGSLAGLLELV